MVLQVFFYIIATLSVFFALGVVFCRKPIYNLLSFLALALCICVLLVGLHTAFWGFLYVLVYAGAILVLFLFVLMLTPYDQSISDLFGAIQLKPDNTSVTNTRRASSRILFGSLAIATVFFLTLAAVIVKSTLNPVLANSGQTNLIENSGIALLLKNYALGIFISAFLILTATVGLAVLADPKEPS